MTDYGFWRLGPLCGMRGEHQGWFRLFGVGLAWKDVRQEPPVFSERYGFVRRLKLGWLWIWGLT